MFPQRREIDVDRDAGMS